MTKKYELTDEVNSIGLHRIRYLRDLPGINKGELGGWIEKEENLDQYGDARVGGNAEVAGNDDWMIVGPIGSRDAYTTIFREPNRIAVVCGCFYGSLDEFAAQVIKTHVDNQHAKAYLAMIEMAKARFK